MNKVWTNIYTLHHPEIEKRFSIVVGNDLHFHPNIKTEKLNKILNEIAKIDPEYIMLPGDIISYTEAIESTYEKDRLLRLLQEFGEIAPTMISLGSHDFYKKEDKLNPVLDKKLYHKINELSNVQILHNTHYIDERIYVAGITQSYGYYHPNNNFAKHPIKPVQEDKAVLLKDLETHLKELKNLPKDKLKFMLIHSPIHIDSIEVQAYLKEFDYILSGHMHNGCVPSFLFPFWKSTRGFIAPSGALFPKNERDTLRFQGDKLLVNGPLTTIQPDSILKYYLNEFFPSYLSVLEFVKYSTEEKENNKIPKRTLYR